MKYTFSRIAFLVFALFASASIAPLSALATAGPMTSTVVVHPFDMATGFGDVISNPTKWFFYNDVTDAIDNTLGSFVTGPSTPALGTGSAQISVTGSERRNLATYQFSGTPLNTITTLAFSTYNPSAGNGGSTNRSAYLNFNVDFNGSDTWQKRLVFVPSANGTVTQDSWKQWDAINGGNALWSYSGATWPDTLTGPDAGLTGISGTVARTWSAILADYPLIRVRVTDSWLGLRVGEPYTDGYTENIDSFVFGTSTQVTTFDFDPAPNVQVTIVKYVGTEEATNENAGGASFPMHAIFPGGEGDYALSTTGFNNENPYRATTSQMPSGSDYSTFENLGTTCTGENPFALVGYSTGSTLESAVLNGSGENTPTLTTPAFTGLLHDMYVVVWNKPCPMTGTLTVIKDTLGADGTFALSGDNGLGNWTITTVGGVGEKTFTNLTPGTYHVTETVPSGWTQIDTDCGTVTVTAGGETTCTITNGKNSKLGEIRGTKYEDVDGDGNIRDKNNHRLAGWTIYLDTNNNGILNVGEQSTTTDVHGEYRFKYLPAGRYVVREVQQSGWVQTAPGGWKHTITLQAGKVSKKNDFGNFKLGTISGMKFNDMNGNKIKDVGEMGLPNWTILLTKIGRGTSVATTDSNGMYTFTDIGPGTYKLREDQKEGWTQTTKNPKNIMMRSSQNITDKNFGNIHSTHMVWHGEESDE